MSLLSSSHLTAIITRQHQHDLRREAAQWHAATRALSAPTPQTGAANRRHAGAASWLALSWLARAARQLADPHPAHPAPPAPGAEGWSAG